MSQSILSSKTPMSSTITSFLPLVKTQPPANFSPFPAAVCIPSFEIAHPTSPTATLPSSPVTSLPNQLILTPTASLSDTPNKSTSQTTSPLPETSPLNSSSTYSNHEPSPSPSLSEHTENALLPTSTSVINSHLMVTRAKVGVFKPRILLTEYL